MGEFGTSKQHKARQKHLCAQCHQAIEPGSDYIASSGRWEGEFYRNRAHMECQAAARDYAERFDCYGENRPWFADGEFEPEDHAWMLANHPIVYDRLGWKAHETSEDAA